MIKVARYWQSSFLELFDSVPKNLMKLNLSLSNRLYSTPHLINLCMFWSNLSLVYFPLFLWIHGNVMWEINDPVFKFPQ